MTLNRYSSPVTLGKKQVEGLFNGNPIYVQEKIDGSQFSFGELNDGSLCCRSRNKIIDLNIADMFTRAVETAKYLYENNHLITGWTYRCEFVGKNKQNTLTYERVPEGFLVLFDIDRGDGDYVLPDQGTIEFGLHGIETAPLLDVIYTKPTEEELKHFLTTDSILGGPIEGIVLKNYELFGHDGKVLMGKYVSNQFKEQHVTDWKKRNPNRKDTIESIIQSLKTEARWKKAVQHLNEEGKLKNSPEDIGLLIKEIEDDIVANDAKEIEELLFIHFKKEIIKGVTKNFPEWYKTTLG